MTSPETGSGASALTVIAFAGAIFMLGLLAGELLDVDPLGALSGSRLPNEIHVREQGNGMRVVWNPYDCTYHKVRWEERDDPKPGINGMPHYVDDAATRDLTRRCRQLKPGILHR